MGRLVDASKYEEEILLTMRCWSCSPALSPSEAQRSIGNLRVALNMLRKMPTIDAKPIVHAKWIVSKDDFDDGFGERDYPFCSNCHTGVYKHDAKYYCPNCGAKMDAENHDETNI